MRNSLPGFNLFSGCFRNTEFAQDIFHQTPTSKGRLDQVESYEGGEKEPPLTDPYAKCEADEDKGSGDPAYISFHGHFKTPY